MRVRVGHVRNRKFLTWKTGYQKWGAEQMVENETRLRSGT